ncbi:class I SAM-dependent methyltransferase [Thermodesulfobacteriota bacterium]
MESRHTGLTAKMEAFDTFWEGPENVEKGYQSFYKFYKSNYLRHIPDDKHIRILVICCGPGYFVSMLKKEGYHDVLGIDSDPQKAQHGIDRGLNCMAAYAFDFLEAANGPFDLIFVEQEINHLTKDEILQFLSLCRKNLADEGRLIVHSLNGANPITGSEALAQNFDHYNTFTEYSLRQVLQYSGFDEIHVRPLRLYVFYTNPLNYIGLAVDFILNQLFRLFFLFYGKENRHFAKKIAAICKKSAK